MNKWMIAAVLAAAVIAGGSCISCTTQERPVFSDAMAVWRMDQSPGETKPFAPVGVKEIRAGIALTGEERVESPAYGGIWESSDLVHWKRSDKKLPSWRECTCFFEWNGRGYGAF